MKTTKFFKITALAAAISGLSACQLFDSDGVALTPDTTSQGPAVDGLLQGMFCYADINDNAKFDDGTDIAADGLTGPDGIYSITGQDVSNSAIVCRAEDGATDTATEDAFTGQLSAPAGSKAVSPVTTLLKEVGNEATVRTILGITDETVDLTSNPQENATLAKAAVKVQSVVKTIVNALETQAGGGQDLATKRAMVAATYKALAESSEGANVDITTDKTTISSAVTAATKAVTGDENATNAAADEIAVAATSVANNVETQFSAVEAQDLTPADLKNELDKAQKESSSEEKVNEAITSNVTTDAEIAIDPDLDKDTSEVPAEEPTGTGTEDGDDTGLTTP